MAIPPSIPTSFVPKQPVSPQPRGKKSGTNAFMLIGGTAFLLSALAAGGMFGYQLYLTGARDAKAASLAEAQRAVSADAVEDFVRLRDRLVAAQELLDNHVELSAFFGLLERSMLGAVSFSSLTVSVADDRTAEISAEGSATSFNALAAQSQALAAERRIRRAVFSDIAVNDDGTVGFSLTARADERLIAPPAGFDGSEEADFTQPTAPAVPVEVPAPQPAAPVTAPTTP